ncbi:MAG: hypothetical protein JWO56_2791 [Acidobacteria bacterium]|jgi:hypothetical protein|nr:hypothetical protein [Acidobacteriota bacterium]
MHVEWTFVVDPSGRAVPATADTRIAIQTVQPGEYLVTLPLPLRGGMEAVVSDGAGFVAATPGDEAGNKPRTLRVLTLTPQHDFGPSDFTLVIRSAAA